MHKQLIYVGLLLSLSIVPLLVNAQLTQPLKLGDEHTEVSILQKVLNSIGKTIAKEGPGSPGNETTYLGGLTATALKSFQCDRGIVCDGDPDSTGFGLLGPKTRSILNTLYSGISNTFSSNSQLAQVAPTSGLVAHYTFDSSTASDASGNGNNGTVNGASSVSGRIDNALSFDGADDYVNVPANSSIANIWDSGGTIAFWVRPDSAGEADAGIWFSKSAYWSIGANPGHSAGETGFEFNVDFSNTPKWRTDTTGINFNSWNHVVMTYNSDSISNDPILYVNGSVVSLTEIVTPTGARSSESTRALQIGSNEAASRATDGLIDDIRIYNRALTPSEITELYNYTGGGTPPSPTPVNGLCGSTNNSCTTGTLNDTADSSTSYQWQCTGSNGGTTASCQATIPVVTPPAPSGGTIDVRRSGASSSFVQYDNGADLRTVLAGGNSVFFGLNFNMRAWPSSDIAPLFTVSSGALGPHRYFRLQISESDRSFEVQGRELGDAATATQYFDTNQVISLSTWYAGGVWIEPLGTTWRFTTFIQRHGGPLVKITNTVDATEYTNSSETRDLYGLWKHAYYTGSGIGSAHQINADKATPVVVRNPTLSEIEGFISAHDPSDIWTGNDYLMRPDFSDWTEDANGGSWDIVGTQPALSGTLSLDSWEPGSTPPAGDTTPPIISSISASNITSTGATISWTTNEQSDTQIEYGIATNYGSQTTRNSSMVTSHSQTLSGLTPNTLYHYRVISRDAVPNTTTSPDQTFTTAQTQVVTGGTCTTVSQYGITWIFDRAYTCGQFVNGDWWVLGPVIVSSVSPGWDGSRNGSMIDPVPLAPQGFDSRVTQYAFSDANRTKFPVTITGVKSLISAISLAQNKIGGAYEALQIAAVLTVVNSAPASGSFRPPFVSGQKPIWNTSQMNYGLVPNLPVPAGITLPNMSTVMTRINTYFGPEVWGTTIIPQNNVTDVYPAYENEASSKLSLMAMLNIPQKQEYINRIVQRGIDHYSISLQNVNAWQANGGFGVGLKWPIVFAGILLNDASMKSPPLYIPNYANNAIFKFPEDGYTYVGAPTTQYPNGKIMFGIDYAGRGLPINLCLSNCMARDPAGILDPEEMPNGGGYRQITSNFWVGQTLAAHLMGAKSIWNHDEYFDYIDRWLSEPDTWTDDSDTYKANVWGYGDGSGLTRAMWTLYRNASPQGGGLIPGSCSSTLNTCSAGTFSDTTDTSTNYLWSCVGLNGGSTASCSSPIPVAVNGTCGPTVNACSTGSLNNIADSSTNYLWQCIGSNGGTSVQCSQAIPTTTYTLTTAKAGTGLGTVAGTGINCGSDCSETLNAGTSITLVATPTTGSTFTGWSGACTGTGSCTITVNSNTSALATFTLAPTVDTTSPVISNLTMKRTPGKTIEVRWVTNELSSTQLEHGTTQSYGITTPLVSTLTASHYAKIPDLIRGTTYHLRAISVDLAGNIARSQNISFLTPLKPSTITSLVATAGSVILSWANPDDTDYTEVTIYRGTTALTTPTGTPIATITSTTTTSYTDTNVQPSTTYVYTIFTRDTDGVQSDPMSITFTTLAADAPPPVSSGGGGAGGSKRPILSTPIPTPLNFVFPTSVTPTQISSFFRDLKLGSTGTDVKSLQQYLNNNGFTIATVGAGSRGLETTTFGPATKAALIRFQVSRGLPATGLFGPMTRAKIAGTTTATPTYTAPVTNTTTTTSFTRNLTIGSTGLDVKSLQQYLNNKGFTITLTGPGSKGLETTTFGPGTKAALIRFQKANNIIPASGYFGPVTRGKVR